MTSYTHGNHKPVLVCMHVQNRNARYARITNIRYPHLPDLTHPPWPSFTALIGRVFNWQIVELAHCYCSDQCNAPSTVSVECDHAGAHTFGRVQCQNVAAGRADRLYNFSGTNMPDPTLDSAYRAFLSQRCPRNGNGEVLNDLDPTTPDTFDNHYYTNIEQNRGFLISDQELKSSPEAQGTTAPIVDRFAGSQDAFFGSFA